MVSYVSGGSSRYIPAYVSCGGVRDGPFSPGTKTLETRVAIFNARVAIQGAVGAGGGFGSRDGVELIRDFTL